MLVEDKERERRRVISVRVINRNSWREALLGRTQSEPSRGKSAIATPPNIGIRKMCSLWLNTQQCGAVSPRQVTKGSSDLGGHLMEGSSASRGCSSSSTQEEASS